MGSHARRNQLARRIAVEAARLAVDGRCSDLAYLRRKAAKQLGCNDPKAWPDLVVIEATLREQQRLFRGPEQAAALAQLRRRAVVVMQMLSQFRPRLTGAVLDGTADEHSHVRILLTADEPEAVVRALIDKRVVWRASKTRMRWSRGRTIDRPSLRLFVEGTEVELILLVSNDRDDPPFEEDGRGPMPTASADQVQRMFTSESATLGSQC